MSRRLTIVVTLGAAALVVAPTLSGHSPHLVWNASASAPVGLYRTVPPGSVEVGDLMVVTPPAAIAGLLDERGYLPRGVPLIKRVLALAGTEVCRRGTTIVAYDHAYGEARERDRLGRDLPVWQGCRTLRPDKLRNHACGGRRLCGMSQHCPNRSAQQ